MVSAIAPASAAELAEVLRDRAGQGPGGTVQVRGADTKRRWGGSLSDVDLVLETWRLTGVEEHEPGDLVATVGAGTPLRNLQAVLALAGQRLSLESGSPGATIGGVLATGEAGPLRLRHGAGRDLLIGVEFIRADGKRARSGGKVVKNVAGYDLGRLLCGSYGTLGVITAATFRLHPLPAAQAWVTRPIASTSDLVEAIADIVAAPVAPSAVEIDLRGTRGELCLLVEGTRAGVQARAEAAAKLLGGSIVECPQWWARYPFEVDEVGLKIGVGPARLAHVVEALAHAAGADVALRGSAGAGVVHVALPSTTLPQQLDAAVGAVRGAIGLGPGGRAQGSCVVLTTPPELRTGFDLWGQVPGLALMRRIKAQFDPGGRFASGRFVGGI
jgi:glycolate oxidase FAD binding subunit